MKKTNITIAGIGGVGGYFGGLLARHFENSTTVEINFFARGEHLKTIQQKGLKVIKGDAEFVAKPHVATDKPTELGLADYVIVCTKSYNLEETIQQLKPCIDPNTIILPLLNGVDSRTRILKLLPGNLVPDGCAYIVSRIKQAGVIENSGNIQKLSFGLDAVVNEKFTLLEDLFKQAGIEATLSQQASTVIWEKFIFISPTATATSYFNNTVGEITEDEEKFKTYLSLVNEVANLAKAKGIKVSENIIEKTLTVFKSLPFKTTSSMHSDFLSKKPETELQSLTGYVVNEANACGIAVPTFKMMYSELKKR